jgi:hypothetical protein
LDKLMLLFEMIMAMRRLLELKTHSECIQVDKACVDYTDCRKYQSCSCNAKCMTLHLINFVIMYIQGEKMV